jgi:hypothetical protein
MPSDGISSHTFQSPSLKPILAVINLGWYPFKIVSDCPAIHSKLLPLLKIEMISNQIKNSNLNCTMSSSYTNFSVKCMLYVIMQIRLSEKEIEM